MALILRCDWNGHGKQLSPSESPIFIGDILCCQTCGKLANGDSLSTISATEQKGNYPDLAALQKYFNTFLSGYWYRYEDMFLPTDKWNPDLRTILGNYDCWGKTIAGWEKSSTPIVIVFVKEKNFLIVTWPKPVNVIGSGSSVNYLNKVLTRNKII